MNLVSSIYCTTFKVTRQLQPSQHMSIRKFKINWHLWHWTLLPKKQETKSLTYNFNRLNSFLMQSTSLFINISHDKTMSEVLLIPQLITGWQQTFKIFPHDDSSSKRDCTSSNVLFFAGVRFITHLAILSNDGRCFWARIWNCKTTCQLKQGSANTRQQPSASPWKNCYRAVQNQGQIGPKVTGTTDIRNALRVPLTNIFPTGWDILLQESKPWSLTTSCNKFACAKHSLIYWGPVCKIKPGWNRSTVQWRLPSPALMDLKKVSTGNPRTVVPTFSVSWTLLSIWLKAVNPFDITSSCCYQ